MTAGPSFAGKALKVLELYSGKPERIVLWGRKLFGGGILKNSMNETSNQIN